MSLTFGRKIKAARKAKNYTQKQLAQIIGAAHNSISDWENDKNKPDPDMIELLCGVLEITPNYLLARTEEDFSPKEKLLIKRYRELDDYGRGTIELLIDREVTRKQQIDRIEEEASPLRKVRPIALYCQRVSAGSGQLLIDDIPPEIINIPDTRENRHVTFAINVCGSSMEPAFSDGDIVLVEKTPAIDTGEIGIFFIDGNSYIKKLGKEELISLNPAYENIPLNDTARCMGRVVGKL